MSDIFDKSDRKCFERVGRVVGGKNFLRLLQTKGEITMVCTNLDKRSCLKGLKGVSRCLWKKKRLKDWKG